MSFAELQIPEKVQAELKKHEIDEPTAVQKAVIPEISQGQSILVQSPTGTGKTLAYLLPLFEKVDLEIKNNQIVIIVPTHELAVQIKKECEKLSPAYEQSIKSVLIVGNVSAKRQIEKLKAKPQIIIGTAGRIAELIKLKKIKMHTVKNIVIDEADVLLKHEQKETIKQIVKATQRDRKMYFFSASNAHTYADLCRQIAPEVEEIIVTGEGSLPANIEHQYLFIADKRAKFRYLKKIISHNQTEKILVFIRKIEDAEFLYERFKHHQFDVEILHGEDYKKNRQQALDNFRRGKTKVLLCSDVAARGLDVDDVNIVVNYDLPFESNTYLHRVGRTGRKGKAGQAISFVLANEKKLLKKIGNELEIEIKDQKESKFLKED